MNLRFPAALLVCALLLTNPLWLFPAAGDRPYRYEVTALEAPPDDPEGLRSVDGGVVGVACDDREGYDCGAEAAMAISNRSLGPTLGDPGDRSQRYLATPEGYYERYRFRNDADELRYGWRPMPAETVVRAVAVPATALPPDLETTVREQGSTRRLERLPEQQGQHVGEPPALLVHVEDEFPRYRVLTVEQVDTDPLALAAGRGLLGLFGLALVYGEHRRSLPDQHASLLYADDRTI